MSYEDHVEEHRRLVILRVLAEDPHYSMNESLLTDWVNKFRVSSTRDQVVTSIRWLAEQGFVKVNEIRGVSFAELTKAGRAVATGGRRHPGVQAPSPHD